MSTINVFNFIAHEPSSELIPDNVINEDVVASFDLVLTDLLLNQEETVPIIVENPLELLEDNTTSLLAANLFIPLPDDAVESDTAEEAKLIVEQLNEEVPVPLSPEPSVATVVIALPPVLPAIQPKPERVITEEKAPLSTIELPIATEELINTEEIALPLATQAIANTREGSESSGFSAMVLATLASEESLTNEPLTVLDEESLESIANIEQFVYQDNIVYSKKELSNANSTPTAGYELPTLVSEEQWGEQFSEQIVWLAKQGINRAELQLNPSELGPIEITIELDKENTAAVVFNTTNENIKDLIAEHLPKLKHYFAKEGIELKEPTLLSSFTPGGEQDGRQRNQFNKGQLRKLVTVETTTEENNPISNRHNPGLGYINFYI